jgi:hypothetical protein
MREAVESLRRCPLRALQATYEMTCGWASSESVALRSKKPEGGPLSEVILVIDILEIASLGPFDPGSFP